MLHNPSYLFQKTDFFGEPTKRYTKLAEPNPKFCGMTIDEYLKEIGEKNEHYKKINQINNLLKDGSKMMKKGFDEFEKFISTNNVSNIDDLQGLRYFFYAYITDPSVRNIIDQQDFTELYHNPSFNVEDFNRVDDEMKSKLPYYIKTYVPLNKFLSA